MTSERQIAANKRNAQRSTGPRSVAGKAKVSVNAIKHGLRGRDVVLPTEDKDEFDSFRIDLLADLAPVGGLETALAEEVAILLWRLRRVRSSRPRSIDAASRSLNVKKAAEDCRRYETSNDDWMHGFLEGKEVADRDREAHDDAERTLANARAGLDEPSFKVTLVLEMCAGPLLNLWRHEHPLRRSLYKTLHELQRLQAARRGEYVSAPAVVDVHVDGPAQPPSTVPAEDADGSVSGEDADYQMNGRWLGRVALFCKISTRCFSVS
jgi:hypothetical protein